MFLRAPAESEAVALLYQGDLDQQGFVMNGTRLWAWRPEVCEAFSALRALLTSRSTLSARELAVIVCANAASLGNSYCALAWGTRLAAAADASTAAAVLKGAKSDALSAREQALAIWSRKVASDPNATTAADVVELRTAGFGEQEIFEATAFAAFRVAFSTISDALGANPDRQLVAAAPPEVSRAIDFGRPVDAPDA